MDRENVRWVLAFDASCGTCREISSAVEAACGARVEILPLGRPDVQHWRELSMGKAAPWMPTLFRVDGAESVRSWVGPRMALPLVRRLGLRATVRVLGALGQFRPAASTDPGKQPVQGISRAHVLRLGAGAVVAAGVIFAGRTPAAANPLAKSYAEARRWAAANASRLPRTYDELVELPAVYRKAVYELTPPATRATFWREQLTRFRASHLAKLTEQQQAVLDRALLMISQERTFQSPEAVRPEVDELTAAAINEFGRDTAFSLIATLGPGITLAAKQPDCGICECASNSDWCAAGRYCRQITCSLECDQSHGCYCFKLCGTWNNYECDGYCERIS